MNMKKTKVKWQKKFKLKIGFKPIIGLNSFKKKKILSIIGKSEKSIYKLKMHTPVS